MTRGSDAGERAVSPVVGVILMVAITVVLAAIIGQFALGFGAQASESPPQVGFTFDRQPSGDLVVTHAGGGQLDADRLTVTAGGAVVSGVFSGEITAGDSGTVPASELSAGDEVLIIYESGQGDDYVLGRFSYE